MRRSSHWAVLLVGGLLVAATMWGGGGRSLAAASVGPAVPLPGSQSQLLGVTCTSSTSCWAVGSYDNSSGAEVNQALHWNGSKWSLVATPDPGGTGVGGVNVLAAVGCVTASDCWAVGSTFTLNQALHWNGSKWSLVSTPTPGGTLAGDFNQLNSVRCTSASSCWAVGDYGSTGSTTVTLNQALHWNGTTWSQVTTPNPGGTTSGDSNTLNTVRCTSASNCWAAGSYGSSATLSQALRWNGTAWSQVTTPSPGGTAAKDFTTLGGVACTSASSCWAAGAYGNRGVPVTSLNLALHWNGTAWSQATAPDPDGTGAGASNELVAATCTSASSCWAVGDYGSISGGVGTVLNQALHWNGTAWTLVTTPDPGGTANGDFDQLTAIGCTSASNCWAVGVRQASATDITYRNQALHWNGTAWSTG